jgi:hypothetical protein
MFYRVEQYILKQTFYRYPFSTGNGEGGKYTPTEKNVPNREYHRHSVLVNIFENR